MRLIRFAGFTAWIFFLIFAPLPAATQTVAPTPDARATTIAPAQSARSLRGGAASQIGANGAAIVLEVNKGTLIRLSAPAATVFIANPDIATFR